MNSLHFISTQVDNLIHTPDEKSLEDVRFPDVVEHKQSEDDEASPLLEDKEESSAIEEDDIVAEIEERLVISVLLYIPRALLSLISALLSLFTLPYRLLRPLIISTPSVIESKDYALDPDLASEARDDVARSLQSPYGGRTPRLPKSHRKQQSSISIKLIFPPRPLLRPNVKKTLALDLDETLIHSISRNPKFSQGQMVEIKLHPLMPPTLYLVNKRPYCDQFLKAVSQWYNLVIFTASVQTYADPMIDWLEQDRKYFSKRYYRQHCNMTTAGYIKDLSVVEQDLGKVVIVDNSPISYARNENNAVPVEGWISDPTDHSLLNLIPFLNALRYASDVRSLLSLRIGEEAFDSS